MTGFIKTPWSGEQVDALNKFQRNEAVHEFTCPSPHDGLDRTLYATRDGWRCPHCEYQQDWAHEAMFRQMPTESKLPCDVLLPPSTIIRKGCDMSVLKTALSVRGHYAPSQNRFDDPLPTNPEDWTTF